VPALPKYVHRLVKVVVQVEWSEVQMVDRWYQFGLIFPGKAEPKAFAGLIYELKN
jgi:hypothetical protein